MYLLLVDGIDHRFAIAAVVFTIAAATDFFDGYLARRWQQTSTLGAFLDSVADKLLVAAVLLALVEVGRAWAWAAAVIIGRELAVMGLRGLAAMDGTKVPPSIWGKIKANLQFIAIGFAIIRFDEPLGAMFWDEWLMAAAVVATVISGVEYFRRYSRVLRPVA
jgi:CDP-diacylglycerol--glycerol-3-phosphate 3-phosphatidyltransferase